MHDLSPKKSKFGPYIEYLFTQEQGQLLVCSHWSNRGKYLLIKVWAQDNNYHYSHTGPCDNLGLSYPEEYVYEDWIKRCCGSSTN